MTSLVRLYAGRLLCVGLVWLALTSCSSVGKGPGGRITLGNVILPPGPDLACPCRTYACRAGLVDEPTIVLADHERAHVYQYMVLGLLFLPLYLLSGGAVSERNRFEQAADRYARTGRGWWPWARDDMK